MSDGGDFRPDAGEVVDAGGVRCRMWSGLGSGGSAVDSFSLYSVDVELP